MIILASILGSMLYMVVAGYTFQHMRSISREQWVQVEDIFGAIFWPCAWLFIFGMRLSAVKKVDSHGR